MLSLSIRCRMGIYEIGEKVGQAWAQRSRSDEKKRPLLSGRCYYEQKNRYFKRKSAQKRKYVGSCQGLYEGAENAGHTVTEFFLDSMNIHGCKGCFGGKSSLECPCVQKDDMDKIYTSVKNCDVIVLANASILLEHERSDKNGH